MRSLGLLVLGTTLAIPKCHIVMSNPDDIYWMEDVPTTKHGVCAHLSMGFIEGRKIWDVEHPQGVNPQTHMSLSTETKIFHDPNKALHWISTVCARD